MVKTGPTALPDSLRWTPALAKLPALSIRQPYAWLVARGIKDLENRSRQTHYRGQFLVHAGLNQSDLDEDVRNELGALTRVMWPKKVELGGVIGVVEIVDCVRRSNSPWKHPASWGWVLANAHPLKFRPCKGALGFFKPKW